MKKNKVSKAEKQRRLRQSELAKGVSFGVNGEKFTPIGKNKTKADFMNCNGDL